MNSALCHRPEVAQAKPVDRLATAPMILSTDKISPRSRRELLSCDEGNHQLTLSGQDTVIKSSFCTEGFTFSLEKPRHLLPWTASSVPFWFNIKCYLGADEMAEWVSVLNAKSSTLTLIPGTHMVESLLTFRVSMSVPFPSDNK